METITEKLKKAFDQSTAFNYRSVADEGMNGCISRILGNLRYKLNAVETEQMRNSNFIPDTEDFDSERAEETRRRLQALTGKEVTMQTEEGTNYIDLPIMKLHLSTDDGFTITLGCLKQNSTNNNRYNLNDSCYGNSLENLLILTAMLYRWTRDNETAVQRKILKLRKKDKQKQINSATAQVLITRFMKEKGFEFHCEYKDARAIVTVKVDDKALIVNCLYKKLNEDLADIEETIEMIRALDKRWGKYLYITSAKRHQFTKPEDIENTEQQREMNWDEEDETMPAETPFTIPEPLPSEDLPF